MSAEPRGREKRRCERVRMASLKHVWNLSEGGAYIATETPKRLGAKIHMELKLGREGPTFRSLATVVRVLHRPNPKLGEPAGMAIQFIDLTEEQRSILKQFLAQCQVQPGPGIQP